MLIFIFIDTILDKKMKKKCIVFYHDEKIHFLNKISFVWSFTCHVTTTRHWMKIEEPSIAYMYYKWLVVGEIMTESIFETVLRRRLKKKCNTVRIPKKNKI